APDKARTTRWIVGASAFVLVAYGAYGLYYTFGEAMRAPIGGWKPLGDEFPISWAFVLSALWLLVGTAAVWYGVNHRRLVEFFHETEVELSKVSWASKNEVIGSSVVVLVVTFVLAVWIGLLDRSFLALFQKLGY
ncbi:MAG: preprotein translocase subunit SecE, partial [Planctomycetota bacterium]